MLKIDAATLARVLRDQGARALTQAEADALASSVADSKSGEELLANTLAAVRRLIYALTPGVPRI
jgi:hypothetical protein